MRYLIFAGICLLLIGIAVIFQVVNYKIKVKVYAKRLRHFFVYSEYPGDLSVYKRQKEHERWLERSGNTSGVEVVMILYRDKMNPLEEWEQYEVRKFEKTKEKMIERDTEIEKKKGRDFFLKKIHNQESQLLPDAVDMFDNLESKLNGIRISAKKYTDYARLLRDILGRSL